MATVYTQTERSSGVYTATLADENGDAVTALDSLVVWLRDLQTGAYLNSRENQSLLNANGGTFSAGTFTWAMSPADHAIVGGDSRERHEAVFRATWDSGTKARTWSILFDVTNYAPVTA